MYMPVPMQSLYFYGHLPKFFLRIKKLQHKHIKMRRPHLGKMVYFLYILLIASTSLRKATITTTIK